MIQEAVQEIINRGELIPWLMIPPVAAIVTWLHVWMALKMVFYPMDFWGIRIGPLPLGWQGIVPRKAGKIAGIITDQTLTKLGSLHEFFEAMDPGEMADLISEYIDQDLENLIDDVMNTRHASLWSNVPYAIKRRVYAEARLQIPTIMRNMVSELTYSVEDLVDMRKMVVSKMENDRQLMVNLFQRVGKNEINFIWHISALIGFFFGLVQMVIWLFIDAHWTITFWAALWGLLTNWIAIWMVFNPVNPHPRRYPQLFTRISGFPYIKPKIGIGVYNFQGAFMKRQPEVSKQFAEITTMELITVQSIMNEMMYGERRDRTFRIIRRYVDKVVDQSLLVKVGLQVGMGPKGFQQFKHDLVDKSIEATMIPIQDPKMNESRGAKIVHLLQERIEALTPIEFQKLLRPAFEEDEWQLIVLGGLTGALAGYIQYLVGFK